jgi:hypothetical protein
MDSYSLDEQKCPLSGGQRHHHKPRQRRAQPDQQPHAQRREHELEHPIAQTPHPCVARLNRSARDAGTAAGTTPSTIPADDGSTTTRGADGTPSGRASLPPDADTSPTSARNAANARSYTAVRDEPLASANRSAHSASPSSSLNGTRRFGVFATPQSVHTEPVVCTQKRVPTVTGDPKPARGWRGAGFGSAPWITRGQGSEHRTRPMALCHALKRMSSSAHT